MKYYVDSKEKTDSYFQGLFKGCGLGISMSMRKIEPKTILAVETRAHQLSAFTLQLKVLLAALFFAIWLEVEYKFCHSL